MKTWVLLLARALGLFTVARLLTRNRLRILCYHSFGDGDVLQFRPGLFIAPDVFEQRLRWLARAQFPILSLDDAIVALERQTLPPCAVAITIDDGMQGVYRHGWPILKAANMPATLYLTTHHQQSQTPVFDVTVGYLVWKSDREVVNLDTLSLAVDGADRDGRLRLTASAREALAEAAIRAGGAMDESQRSEWLRALGGALDVDADAVSQAGAFTIVDDAMVHDMLAAGIDLQLHTHNHRFPLDATIAAEELAVNARAIESFGAPRPLHFCYPSGEWEPGHWPLLDAAGVRSATTCDAGLARHSTPRQALCRILDSTHVTQVEFEAEMSGFLDLLRDMRGNRARSH